MKIKEIFDFVDGVKPNAFSNTQKIMWLNEVEGMVQTDVMLLASIIQYVYSATSTQSMTFTDSTIVFTTQPHFSVGGKITITGLTTLTSNNVSGKVIRDISSDGLTYTFDAGTFSAGTESGTVTFDGSETELLVNPPHQKIYYTYLMAMIDFANGEYDKYQNAMALFNTFFGNYTKWFIENYHPADGECETLGYYISAYAIAVKHGYVGTEEEWLLSLNGDQAKSTTDAQAAAAAAETSAESASTSATAAGAFASQSATNAETATNQATISTNAASTATTKAQEIAQSANDAALAKTAAESARDAAQSSASSASTSAQTATTKATEAAGSATDANDAKDAAIAATTTKADKVTNAAPGNLAALDVNGNLIDSGLNITDIASLSAAKYGVTGVGRSASVLTRIWDAIGLTAQVGTDGDNTDIVNDFDSIAPFNRRKCVGIWAAGDDKAVFTPQSYYGDADYTENGTKGDYVAVDVTPFYWYESSDGSILGVSMSPHPGWSIHPVCIDKDGNVRAHTYLPCYALAKNANGAAVSLPGLRNEFGCYKDLRDYAKTYANVAAANYACIEPSVVDHYEYLLAIIEFANQNVQSIMQGATGMRYAADSITALSATTGVVSAAAGAVFIAGQPVYIGTDYGASTKASHTITSIVKCDADGTINASGSYYLLTLTAYSDATNITAITSPVIASRPWQTGACAGVSTPSGSPGSNIDTKHPCRYRWRENPWGNQNMTAVDLFNVRVADGASFYLDWYYLPDPLSYYPASVSAPTQADLSTANGFVKIGTTPTAAYSDGYIKKHSASVDYPAIKFPILQTAGSATYFCDYAYLVSAFAVRAVRRRGGLSYGVAAGPCFVSAYSAPAFVAWAYGAGLFFSQ